MIFWQFVSNSFEIFSLYSAQLEEYSAYLLLFLYVAEIKLHLKSIQVDFYCINLELNSFNEDAHKFCFTILLSFSPYSLPWSNTVPSLYSKNQLGCFWDVIWSLQHTRRARGMLNILPTLLSIRKRFQKN